MLTFDKTHDIITFVAADSQDKTKNFKKLKKLLTNKKRHDKIAKSLASDNKTKYLDK